MLSDDEFVFKEMDVEGLTPCSAAKKRCPAPMTCLRRNMGRVRGRAMNLRTIGDARGDCMYYVQTEMIKDEKHHFKGHRRHNKHVFKKSPDLMVKRHIRSGKDINDGND